MYPGNMDRKEIYVWFTMEDDLCVFRHIDGRIIKLSISKDRIARHKKYFKTKAQILYTDGDCYHLILPKLDKEFGTVICIDKKYII